MNGDDFFMRMCKEAQDEMASGQTGWKDADSNTLFLAGFGMMSSYLTKKLTRPLWWFAGSVSGAALAYVIKAIVS